MKTENAKYYMVADDQSYKPRLEEGETNTRIWLYEDKESYERDLYIIKTKPETWKLISHGKLHYSP